MWKYHEAYHVCRWFTESFFFMHVPSFSQCQVGLHQLCPGCIFNKKKDSKGGTCSKNQGPKVSKDSIQVLFINPNKFSKDSIQGVPSCRAICQWIHWMKSKMFIFPTQSGWKSRFRLPATSEPSQAKALPKGPPPLAGKCLALVPARPTDAAHPPSATNAWPNLWIFRGQLTGEKGQQLDTPKKIMFKRLAICTFPSLDPIYP